MLTLSISIIIPVFNSEKYLDTCLASVVNSITDRDEIIIVNDGSTDNSLQIINKYIDKCSLVECSKNSGAAFARNQGAHNASKDILIFMDSDVVVQRVQLEQVRKYFHEHNTVHAATLNVDCNFSHGDFFSDFKNLYMSLILSNSCQVVNYIYGSFCVSRRIGFIDWPVTLRMTEDSLWGYKQSKVGLLIHFINEIKITHLKKYTLTSLVKNDFLIASYFARSFITSRRWLTLFSKEKFGHVSKIQKISVVLSIVSIIALSISFYAAFFVVLSWSFINYNLFKFLYVKRGLLFSLKGYLWYFVDNIIYAAGIFHGIVISLKNDDVSNKRELK